MTGQRFYVYYVTIPLPVSIPYSRRQLLMASVCRNSCQKIAIAFFSPNGFMVHCRVGQIAKSKFHQLSTSNKSNRMEADDTCGYFAQQGKQQKDSPQCRKPQQRNTSPGHLFPPGE